jgi:hypothetical protein
MKSLIALVVLKASAHAFGTTLSKALKYTIAP